MKTIPLLIFLVFIFNSCSEEIIVPEKEFSFEKRTAFVNRVYSVVLNDETLFAWAGDRAIIRVNGNQQLEDHVGAVRAIEISRDGKLLLSGSDDNNIKLWDLTTYTLIRTFSEHIPATKDVIFTPDEKSVVSAEGDYIVYWRNAVSGTIGRLPMYGHTSTVNSVDMSADMNKIISCSVDKTIKIWDAATGHLIHSINAHSGGVNEIEVSPIEEQFASCSNDSTVKIWDMNTPSLVKTFKGKMSKIKSISYHSSGNYIAAAGSDKKIYIWNLQTDSVELILEEHTAVINSVKFSRNGDNIISGDNDDKVIIWKNVFSKK